MLTGRFSAAQDTGRASRAFFGHRLQDKTAAQLFVQTQDFSPSMRNLF
jgi:hypothetical protein